MTQKTFERVELRLGVPSGVVKWGDSEHYLGAPVSPELGAFRYIPPEILENIARHIKYLADKIAFTNVCRHFQAVLGEGNRLLWFDVINECALESGPDKIHAQFGPHNYFWDAKLRAGVPGWGSCSTYCTCCLRLGLQRLYFDRITACDRCARRNLAPVSGLACIPDFDVRQIRTTALTESVCTSLGIHQYERANLHRYYCWKPNTDRRLARRLEYPTELDAVVAATKQERRAFYSRCAVFFAPEKSKHQEICLVAWRNLWVHIQNYVELRNAAYWSPGGLNMYPYARKTAAQLLCELKDFLWRSSWGAWQAHVSIVRQYGLELKEMTADEIETWGKLIVYRIIHSGSMLACLDFRMPVCRDVRL